MKITLSRKLELRATRLIGKLAFPVERKLELAVAQWVAERLSPRRKLSAEDLCDAKVGLLPRRPTLLAQRLVGQCARLGLLDFDGRTGEIRAVTVAGREALERRTVYVPEEGCWTLHWCMDPLVPDRLLSAAPHAEPLADDELNADAPKRTFMQVPKELTDLVSKELEPPFDKGAVRIDELKAKVEDARPTLEATVALDVEADVRAARIRLSTRTGAERTHEYPAIDFEQVWSQLLQQTGLSDAWKEKRLLLPFDNVSEGGRTSFKELMPVAGPTIAGLGRFAPLQIADVPVGPRTKADAQRWFEWLLERRLAKYQWDDTFTDTVRAVLATFPRRDVAAPGRRGLSSSIRARSAGKAPDFAFWRLQAPLDLDPEGVR